MVTDKLFTGQRAMEDLGIYHYGARFYLPGLGRFLSADTIVPGYADPQNLNRYSYVGNSPLNYTDPTGHMRIQDGPQQDTFKPSVANKYVPKPKPKPKPNKPFKQNNNGGGNNKGDNAVTPSIPTTLPTPDPDVTPVVTTTPSFIDTPQVNQPSANADINVAQFIGGAILIVGGIGFIALGSTLIGLAITETVVVSIIPSPLDDLLLLGHRAQAVAGGLAFIYIGVNTVAVGYGEVKDSLTP